MAGRGRGELYVEPSRLDAGSDWDLALLGAIAIRAAQDAAGKLTACHPCERDAVRAEASEFVRWFADAWGIQIDY